MNFCKDILKTVGFLVSTSFFALLDLWITFLGMGYFIVMLLLLTGNATVDEGCVGITWYQHIVCGGMFLYVFIRRFLYESITTLGWFSDLYVKVDVDVVEKGKQ